MVGLGNLQSCFLLFSVILLKLSSICSYPSGPPVSVCLTALPKHTRDGKVIRPQTTPPPYKITVNATTYKPGDIINIKVEGTGSETFKGLFLQVRPVQRAEGDKVRNLPLGTYRRVLKNTKIIGCDVAIDTLVHQDDHVKWTTEFNWVSPLLIKNDVIVRATILANFSIYWINVESEVIHLEDIGPLPAEQLQRPWLTEIISTVQKKDDKKATEESVIARFEKGFNGALDPNGNVMIHYVLDLLPFEDKTIHGKPALPAGFDVSEMSDLSDISLTSNPAGDSGISLTTKSAGFFETSTKSYSGSTDQTLHSEDSEEVSDTGDAKYDEENSLEVESQKSKADTYYEVLVKAVLGGDKIVADALQKIIE